MTALDRRTVLSMLGAGAGTSVLAGCSETADDDTGNGDGSEDADANTDTDTAADSADGDDGSDTQSQQTTVALETERPSYASVLPETNGSGYFYGAIDVSTMTSLLADDTEAGDEPTDPLLANPILIALYCSAALELVGSSRSFEAFQTNNRTDDGAETFVFVDGVYAFTGAYDVDGFVADLEAIEAYEQERTDESHAVYADAETGEVVGIAADVFAISSPNENNPEFDPVTAVERTVATAAGERDPKHELDGGFDELIRAGASEGITLGLSTQDAEFDDATLESPADDTDSLTFAFDAFAGANGVHQQLSVVGDDATARAIVTYADTDRVDVDALESALGTEADALETAVVNDGATAVIDADYTGDLVDD